MAFVTKHICKRQPKRPKNVNKELVWVFFGIVEHRLILLIVGMSSNHQEKSQFNWLCHKFTQFKARTGKFQADKML